MPTSVVMPALEMAQDTGKLIAWRKQEGDDVRKGEILLEVETDKAVVEVEAVADGVLAGVRAVPGDVIPVGQTIAWILGNGETVPTEGVPTQLTSASLQGPPSSTSGAAQSRSETQSGTKRVRISPKARRIAQERGIDVARLTGSGPDGEILVADVLAIDSSTAATKAAPGSAIVPEGAKPAPQALSSIGRLMAERTTQSWTTVPHFFVTRDVEASGLNDAREELSRSITESRGARPTHTDLLISIVARALEQHPRLNASWVGQTIHLHEEINIGVAMAVKEGVVTGVIQGANRIDVAEVALRRRDLAGRARAGRLRPSDINGATFTISNLGMYHVDAFTAIIVPPQAAILAIGEIADRVVAVEGKPAVRPMIALTLCCDHRVVDGVRAAEFLQTLVNGMRSDVSRDA